MLKEHDSAEIVRFRAERAFLSHENEDDGDGDGDGDGEEARCSRHLLNSQIATSGSF